MRIVLPVTAVAALTFASPALGSVINLGTVNPGATVGTTQTVGRFLTLPALPFEANFSFDLASSGNFSITMTAPPKSTLGDCITWEGERQCFITGTSVVAFSTLTVVRPGPTPFEFAWSTGVLDISEPCITDVTDYGSGIICYALSEDAGDGVNLIYSGRLLAFYGMPAGNYSALLTGTATYGDFAYSTLSYSFSVSGNDSGLGGEQPVPEPATLGILGLSAIGLAVLRRRKWG